MRLLEILTMLMASVLPVPANTSMEAGVTVELSPGSTLVAEEMVQVQVGDKFAAIIINPESEEIYSQSDWVEVEK